MGTKIKRKKFLIHPSSQLKYIALSVLPALIMTLFCTYFLVTTGESILKTEKEQHFVEISSVSQALYNLETEGCPQGTANELRRLMNELLPMQTILATTHFDTFVKWEKTRFFIFAGLISILLFVAIIALLSSHRIAGPIIRIRKSVEMLCEGKDIAPVTLRSYDEFKDLAASLDRLRMRLKDKGFLESD
jgi:HAMP domain-containing protein